jgi:hypothetical protein
LKSQYFTFFESSTVTGHDGISSYTIANPRQLQVSVICGGGADVLLEAMSLPVLESPSIASPEKLTHVVLAHIARSQFRLAHLADFRAGLPDIVVPAAFPLHTDVLYRRSSHAIGSCGLVLTPFKFSVIAIYL